MFRRLVRLALVGALAATTVVTFGGDVATPQTGPTGYTVGANFTPAGRLNCGFYSIDLSTGEATRVTPGGETTECADGLTFAPDGTLYAYRNLDTDGLLTVTELITIDPTTRLDVTPVTGYAFLTGTMKCTRDETIPLRLELRQQQKVGKEVVTVHATATTQVDCSPTTTTWGRKMFLTSGAWQAGAAQATGTTISTPDWVAPASVSSGVRLSVVRK